MQRLTANPSKTDKRAYILANSHLAEKANWGDGILALECSDLINLDFYIEFTRVKMAEIDLLIRHILSEKNLFKYDSDILLPERAQSMRSTDQKMLEHNEL